MEKKILIIDGHSILNRAFYGIPFLTNSEGLHTNAIYGFLKTMFKVLDEEKPDYLTVTFDVHGPTFRHELYEEYKGNRKAMPDELREQVPIMKEVLKAMGIQVIEKLGYEADDIIGTIAHMCEGANISATILSGDRDTLQLATEKVKIRIPRTRQGRTDVESYYAADVAKEYRVTPTQFIDVKALMGDSSDNIPGVPGIGEKTASKIIEEFGSIEKAYEHVDELKPPRASKNLKEFWEQAKLSKILATIDINSDISFDFEEALYGNPYTEYAYGFFQELEFKEFLNRFEVGQAENKVEDYFVKLSYEEFDNITKDLSKAESLGVALGDDYISLALSNEKVFYIPLSMDNTDVKDKPDPLESKENKLSYIFGEIDKLIDSKDNFTFVGFNLKKYLGYLNSRKISNYFDGIIAAYLLNPLKNDYDYIAIGKEHLGLMIDENMEEYKKVCYEAYVAYECKNVLTEKLEHTKMLSLFLDMEMPLLFTLYNMERRGIKVEAKELKEYGDMLGDQIVKLEQEIYGGAGEEFNINSPKQLGVILFEKLGLPYGKKTKTGFSTAADTLEKLAEEYPFVSKILEYRQLTKLKSTYADGLANYIEDDGRIRSKLNQTITATGRLSSTEPNLQNIPIRMELGQLIRKVFVPKEGFVFVDADYSQIELRIMAHFSNDEHLIQAYREAEDIHTATAAQVFHLPFDEVTSTQRRNAKAVNFGIIYGISSFGLSQNLSISRKEAEEYIKRYFETYPSVKKFMEECVEKAKENGYAETLLGRRRPIPELKSSNFMQRSFGERVAMNAPIQGTAADIIKIAMIKVEQELVERKMKSQLILQVHDELLIEAAIDEVDQVKEIIKRQMEDAVTLEVPLMVDAHVGENWFETK